MARRSLWKHKVQIAFVSAIVILVVTGGIALRTMTNATVSTQWVRHSHEVIRDLDELLMAVESIEASSRGFLLTGDDSYLANYANDVHRVRQLQISLAGLTSDNSEEQLRVPVLERLIAQKLQRVALLRATRRSEGLEAVAQLVAPGQKLSADIKTLVSLMRDEELGLLAIRDADAKRTQKQSKTVVLLGMLLGLMITGAAGRGVHRDNRRRRLAEDTLKEEEERFSNLANNISQFAWMADEKGSRFWYNQRWFDYTGTTLDEMAGWGWQTVHHPDHVERVVAKITRCLANGQTWEDTFPLRAKDGTYRWFLSRAVPIRDANGKILHWFGTNTDISERKSLEDALFAEQERAEAALSSIGDAVACTDIAGNITYLNGVAERMSGWSTQQAVGQPMAAALCIVDGTTWQPIPDPVQMAISQNRIVHIPPNCILVRRDGSDVQIEDSVAPIHDREGIPTGAVMVFRDVTLARSMALQISHSAQHDFLTGLPNRMLLADRVNQSIAAAPRHLNKVAILFLDLDGFKQINDSLGHAMGDKLLKSVAERLVGCVRASDTVSRQGGDEFVVLLSEVQHLEDAAITARRMLTAVSDSHLIDGHELRVTTSVGVSAYPDDGVDAETLIKNADTAMYQAKESGRQGYRFFKPAMNERAIERQFIEEGLRDALERQELVLHYQPKINIKSGAITGVEALLRWRHPARGMILPANFISVAEDCGLIVPIGAWILSEACGQVRAWTDAGLTSVTLALNVSVREFGDAHFLDRVFSSLDATGFDPTLLELEFTEDVIMARSEVSATILSALREKGVHITVDDFGTGYSSLRYLRTLPVDTLKIDESLVRQINTAGEDTALVAAVIGIARNLKLKVVAEGVETLEELMFLRAHECDEAQGFYFSEPLSAPQFALLLAMGIPDRRLGVPSATAVVKDAVPLQRPSVGEAKAVPRTDGTVRLQGRTRLSRI